MCSRISSASAARAIAAQSPGSATWPPPSPAATLSDSEIEIHQDALDLRVVLERVGGHVATESALLVAAKRSGGVVDVVGIDPDGAGLELAGNVVRLLDVPGPDPGCEPVGRVVGTGDSFVEIGEFDRRQHRPEDFFA